MQACIAALEVRKQGIEKANKHPAGAYLHLPASIADEP